jgi:hypothetical protein
MTYRLEINGVAVSVDTIDELMEVVRAGAGTGPPKAQAAVAKPKRRRAASKPADGGEARSTEPGPLVCRKPHGCGKAFESKNRMAWYCPACTAKRDDGRPV